MFITFSRTRAVMLALAQVWLIVMGTLLSGLMVRFCEATHRLVPLSTAALRHGGILLLLLPLLWIAVAVATALRSDLPDRRKVQAYAAGWLLLVILLVFIGCAVAAPFVHPVAATAAAELE